MTEAREVSRRRPARLALLITVAGVGVLLGLDRRSPERGNRLYHAGKVSAAARIYRASESRNAGSAGSYNLGTALLALDAGGAELSLRHAIELGDSGTVQRANYNLGYLFLASVDSSASPDAAASLLKAAIASNRAALRLDPRDQDARWNLALAQRMLDSVPPRPAGWGEDKGAPDQKNPPGTHSGLRSDEARPVADGGSRKDDQRADRNAENVQMGNAAGRSAITGGMSEAGAGQDPGRMTRAAALQLVRGIGDSPEPLIRGLLWVYRPKGAWANPEKIPGGNQ